MKNKKGFTLIELLAVIVILAIIALIETPIVLNMINSARKNAAKSSALGFIDAIEYNNGFAQTEQAGYTEINGEDLDVTSSIFDNLKIKGKKPSSGYVTIVNGKVESTTMCVENYTVTYINGTATVGEPCNDSGVSVPTFGGTIDNSKQYLLTNVEQTGIVGVAYLNPKNLKVSCSKTNSQIGTGEANESGCMKFYIYDDDGTNYKMILDHNISNTISWNSTGDVLEMKEAKTSLEDNTVDWVGSPRLIEASEIATITGNTSFNGTSSDGYYFGANAAISFSSQNSSQQQKQKSLAWLFDYTNDCNSSGCDTADAASTGYWTSSTVSGFSYIWFVHSFGSLSYDNPNSYHGIRPVITLEKSKLK